MKKQLLISTTLLLLCLNTFAIKGYNVGDTLTVFSEAGLRLRNGPSKDSASITVIPLGEAVIVKSVPNSIYAHSDRFLDIYTIEGFWVEVVYQSFTGYVFDGYLSSLPAPVAKMQGFFSVESDYLDKHFKKKGKVYNTVLLPPENQPKKPYSNPNDIYLQYSQEYENGITYTSVIGDTGSSSDIVFENYSLAEILLLSKLMLSNIKSSKEHQYIFNKVLGKYSLGDLEGAGCSIEITTQDNLIIWHGYCGC
ncbi:MAG: SH3 domain-containing protein [Bacteroidota bacterium]